MSNHNHGTVFKAFLRKQETQSLVEHAVLRDFGEINVLFSCKHCNNTPGGNGNNKHTISRVGECPNIVKEWGFCPVALKCRRCHAPVIKCVIEQVPELRMDEGLLTRLTWIPIAVQLKNLRHRRDSETHKESIRQMREKFGQAAIAWLSSSKEARLDFISLFHEELQTIQIEGTTSQGGSDSKAEASLRNMLARFFLFLYRSLVLGDSEENESRTTIKLNMWIDLAFTLCLNEDGTLSDAHIQLYGQFRSIVLPITSLEIELSSDLLQMFFICYMWQFYWGHRMAAQHRRVMTSSPPASRANLNLRGSADTFAQNAAPAPPPPPSRKRVFTMMDCSSSVANHDRDSRNHRPGNAEAESVQA